MTWTVFLQHPTLVGHRGMGEGVVAGYAENTLASFLAAVEAGAGWVEVDVRRSSDDQLFVWHDAAIRGRYLADMTTAEAEKRGALRVEELLDALPGSTGVVFDVKSSMRDARRDAASTTGTLLAHVCRSTLHGRPAVAQSFDPAALVHMRETFPGLALGFLTWLRFPIHIAMAAAAHLDVQVLAVHAGSLVSGRATGLSDVPPLEEVVDGVHAASRQLMVWCPRPRRARALAGSGVDAMVVDDVPRHVKMLRTTGP